MNKAEQELLELMQELDISTLQNQLSELYEETKNIGGVGGPYGWQKEFHDHGFDHRERAIIAGNREARLEQQQQK